MVKVFQMLIWNEIWLGFISFWILKYIEDYFWWQTFINVSINFEVFGKGSFLDIQGG